ncbi:uracil-DNA glycosylase [Undibacterium sp.]|jgi:uracil-DNA glycosylase|uniref:uracil-DNA glycosylase n=1 Tax=Undibacterium sp. TaxID=1914977 RepID=UPI002C08B8AA|nr:uracil-DNA glycosylase [Undibacterium sp.]HTD02358.1 uracil-DNA glycosylase [Undibacterium sp.]
MKNPDFPPIVQQALTLVHPSWLPAVHAGLAAMQAMDPAYLPSLIDGEFLPNGGRLFAAFSLPVAGVRHVLIGEGPYPREESATGVCFMDGAVRELWSQEPDGGLSKKVNRATSLRNFIKMLLVADGKLAVENTAGTAMAEISAQARQPDSGMIQTLPELQDNLHRRGFLLLNASLVFRASVAPAKDAKAWIPFLRRILDTLYEQHQAAGSLPQLVLWGKIAEQVKQVEVSGQFPHIAAEHPYNLSFIGNQGMHAFFGPMHLLDQS